MWIQSLQAPSNSHRVPLELLVQYTIPLMPGIDAVSPLRQQIRIEELTLRSLQRIEEAFEEGRLIYGEDLSHKPAPHQLFIQSRRR